MDEQQKKWLMIGIVCLLIGVGYWYFFYQQQDKDVTILTENIDELDRKIATAKGLAAKLEDLEKDMELLTIQWEEALKYLPNEDEIENVLKSIELAIRDSNLKKFNFSPGEPEPIDFYSEQQIGINLEGKFPDFLSFLDRLERFDRIVKPRNISLSLKSRGAKDREFKLNINLVVSAYILGGSELP